MGGSYYSRDDHASRVAYRAATAAPVFKHDDDVKKGKVKAGVEPRMNPKGVVRESRDSDAHPVTLPIMLMLDVTGSMQEVPPIIEAKLSKLMGHFLDDKASGKKYLGEAYPAILIGALDDYDAMCNSGGDAEGTLQAGQFESGIEIDNDLERLWLTGRGGGTYEESYELALYFAARKTVHDAWEKRGRKGYVFIIGDEHAYPTVNPAAVKAVIGDTLQAPIKLEDILAEVRQRYHVFFLIPNMTQHYSDPQLERDWVRLLGQQNVLKLEDPERVCEAIVSAVALTEGHVGLDELLSDNVATGLSTALIPLAQAGLAKVSTAGLPTIAGTAGEVERL